MKNRTKEQLAFDCGVKGWAFMSPASLKAHAEHARRLYEAIGFKDQLRLDQLLTIENAAYKEA